MTQALCRVVREVSGTEAVIYGEGPEGPRVKEIICTEGRGLPVQFAGRLDNGGHHKVWHKHIRRIFCQPV